MLEVQKREFEEYGDALNMIMEESVKDCCSDEDKNYLPGESEASDDFVKIRKRARYNTKDITNIDSPGQSKTPHLVEGDGGDCSCCLD